MDGQDERDIERYIRDWKWERKRERDERDRGKEMKRDEEKIYGGYSEREIER
jgi:hypothetical protein